MLILTILLYYIAIFVEDYDPTQSQKPGFSNPKNRVSHISPTIEELLDSSKSASEQRLYAQ